MTGSLADLAARARRARKGLGRGGRRRGRLPPLWREEEVEGVEPWLGGLSLTELSGVLAAAVTWNTSAGHSWAELWLRGDDGPRRTALPGVETAAVLSRGGPARSGRTFAMLSGDPDLLYDVQAGRPVTRVALPDDPAAGDIYLRDMTTGELGTDFRLQAGSNAQLAFARVRDRDVLLVAADNAVVLWDAATGLEAADWDGGVRVWEIVPRS